MLQVGQEVRGRGRIAWIVTRDARDEQQVVAHDSGEGVLVVVVQSQSPGDRPHHFRPGDTVVTGAAFTQVVQERGEQQQVGAAHRRGQARGEDHGLDQVAVHGEHMGAVPGGQVADLRPLRQQPLPQAAPVERLEHRRHGLPGAQEHQQIGQRGVGPPTLRRGAALGEHPERRRGDRQSGACGGGRHPQRQPRIGLGAHTPRQRHLAGVLHHPLGQRATHR